MSTSASASRLIMSLDSQRLKIEQVRHRLSEWQLQLPDFNHHLGLVARFSMRPAMDAFGMSERHLVTAIGQTPGTDALLSLMSEQAFGIKLNEESLFDRYAAGPGQNESGLCYRYLRRVADSGLSLWRVLDRQSGTSLTVTQWEEGPALTVYDRNYSCTCEPGDLLVGRVIDMPAGPVLGAGVINVGKLALDMATVSRREALRHMLSDSVIELLGPTVKQATTDEYS